MSTFIAVLFLTTIGYLTYRFFARNPDSRAFRLAQFRPAAPLAGLLPGNPDHARVAAELHAIDAYTRQDFDDAA